MVNQLIEKFGKNRVENCFSSDNRKEFYIAEDSKTSQSYIVPENEEVFDGDFKIENTGEKNIHHLAVDGCFLTQQQDYKDRKCDLIVFSDNKFCFVELKSNATSENRYNYNTNEAIKQLGLTIDYFDEHKVDFSKHEIEAYIVFQNRLYPNDSAGKKARRLAFFDKYEVHLFEESETEF